MEIKTYNKNLSPIEGQALFRHEKVQFQNTRVCHAYHKSISFLSLYNTNNLKKKKNNWTKFNQVCVKFRVCLY